MAEDVPWLHAEPPTRPTNIREKQRIHTKQLKNKNVKNAILYIYTIYNVTTAFITYADTHYGSDEKEWQGGDLWNIWRLHLSSSSLLCLRRSPWTFMTFMTFWISTPETLGFAAIPTQPFLGPGMEASQDFSGQILQSKDAPNRGLHHLLWSFMHSWCNTSCLQTSADHQIDS